VPAGEWYDKARERVARKDFDPLVQSMYRDSMTMSSNWREEFVAFWGLEEDFSF
jgi:hypothetical protein